MNSSLHKVATTYPIDGAANPVVVLASPVVGRKFVVTKWYLIPDANGTIRFQSRTPGGAAVSLSGLMTLVAGTVYSDGSGDEFVFKANESGDIFQIANAGTINLRGYAVIAEVQV